MYLQLSAFDATALSQSAIPCFYDWGERLAPHKHAARAVQANVVPASLKTLPQPEIYY